MPVKMVTSTPTHSAFETFRDLTHKVSAKDPTFADQLLEEQSDGVTHEQLEEMLRKIDEQAGRLSRSPTFDELKEYRTLIKNFISAAVGQMYELHTSAGWDRMGRQRAYTTVRKVDRKLEEMAEKIRLGQSEQLDIVASHDAIRGMLVDLYM